MRRLLIAAPLLIGALTLPANAWAQSGQIQGFAGLTVRSVTSSSTSSTYGGRLALGLTDNIQIVGEGGRLTDIMSPALATLVDLSPVDVRLSAYYGEAGVRLIGGHGALRPYAEATAGYARMHVGFRGAGPRPDVIINTALQFLDRTEPLVGAGAGLVLEAGPAVVDLGYRYKKIRTGNAVVSALTGGDLGVNQVRLGLGFRF